MIRDIFLFLIALIAIWIVLIILEMVYKWLRRKMNKPRIGFYFFLYNMLERGDYVSINGMVMRFSHIARSGESLNSLLPASDYRNRTDGGELAFNVSYTLDYQYCNPQALVKCDFIYGKYGLKWAASKELARIAEERIKDY